VWSCASGVIVGRGDKAFCSLIAAVKIIKIKESGQKYYFLGLGFWAK
jgi:hypothetical protein